MGLYLVYTHSMFTLITRTCYDICFPFKIWVYDGGNVMWREITDGQRAWRKKLL